MKTTRSPLLLFAVLLGPAGPLCAAGPGEPVSAAPVPPEVVLRQDLNRADAVNARLSTRTVLAAVEGAQFPTRDQAIALAQRGAAEGRAITSSLRAGVRLLGDGPRDDAETALVKAEQARDRLNSSLSKARESNEDRWKDVREDLAERYEQYAGALEEARKLVVDGGVTFQPPEVSAPVSNGAGSSGG